MIEFAFKVAATIVAGVLVILGKRIYPSIRSFLFLRKTARRMRTELTNELRSGGYPGLPLLRLRLGKNLGKDLKILAQSFGLRVPGNDVLDGEGILRWIADTGTQRFLIRADGGSGKTIFGMLLAASWPRFCPAMPVRYIPASDLSRTTSLAEEIERWLNSVGLRTALLVFDALNEAPGEPAEIASSINRLLSPYQGRKIKLLLMFRPRSGKYADVFGKHLRIDQPMPEITLTFDPGVNAQCSFYRHLFAKVRRNETEVKEILEATLGPYPQLPVTREIAVAILTDWQDRIHDPKNHVPLHRSPLHSVFRRVTTDAGGMLREDVKTVAARAMTLVSSGEYTSWFEATGDEAAALKRLSESQDNLGLRVESSDGRFRFPNETHLNVLAALRIAWTIMMRPRIADAVTELRFLHGSMVFDSCAKFLTPAISALMPRESVTRRRDLLVGFVGELIRLGNPPYSFCAHVLCDTLDTDLLPDFARSSLGDSLFGRLLRAIDDDRLRTCEASIKDEARRGRPDAVLDQLFEVFRVYGDSAVDGCLNVLVSINDPTFRSQGAYMLLYWADTHVLADRRRVRVASPPGDAGKGIDNNVYKIVTRLPDIQGKTSLHISFHVAELLDTIREAYEINAFDISDFAPRFKTACNTLLAPDGAVGESPLIPESIRATYVATSDCLRLWAQDISDLSHTGQSGHWMSNIGDLFEITTAQEAAFVLRHQDKPSDASREELEYYLELKEATLGIGRRAYCATFDKRHLRPIVEAWKSPAWVVRWWAFYNMFHIVLYSAKERQDLVGDQLAGFVDELFAPGEPMGLKHRQCRLVDEILDAVEALPFKQSLCKSLRAGAERRFGNADAMEYRSFIAEYENIAGRAALNDYLREYLSHIERLIDRSR